MTMRKMIKECYADNPVICRIVDCNQANDTATTAGKDPQKLLAFVEANLVLKGKHDSSSGITLPSWLEDE